MSYRHPESSPLLLCSKEGVKQFLLDSFFHALTVISNLNLEETGFNFLSLHFHFATRINGVDSVQEKIQANCIRTYTHGDKICSAR